MSEKHLEVKRWWWWWRPKGVCVWLTRLRERWSDVRESKVKRREMDREGKQQGGDGGGGVC